MSASAPNRDEDRALAPPTSRADDSGSASDSRLHALRITFRNIAYTVRLKKRRRSLTWLRRKQPDTEAAASTVPRHKTILKNITGIFREGRLTAVMGSSGAGKTTLLSLIAGDIRSGVMEGTVFVDGTQVIPVVQQRMRDVSGFVFQDDLLLETMTVEEAISMSVRLRLEHGDDEKWRREKLHATLLEFGLQNAAKTKVGTPETKGISGGERKRTAIAMETVIDPQVLFLDEPTSGLDTFTAFSVIETLHQLTRKGHTVVTTIHQPSSDIFRHFDDLLLLAEGRVLYFGPAAAALDYFSRLGYECPKYSNPADFFFMNIIKGIRGDVRESVSENQSKISKLLDEWQRSPEQTALVAQASDLPETQITRTRYRSPFLRQFYYLLGRASKNAIRDPRIIRVRLIQTVFVAVFVGLSFVNLNRLPPQQQLQNKAGVLFFIGLNQFFASATSVMTIFAVEKLVFFREYTAGYYGLTAYYVSKVLVEIVFPALFVLILYYIVGLNPGFSHYLMAALIAVLCSLNGNAIGVLIAATFKNLSVALSVLPVILLPLTLYAGFLLNGSTIPSYLIWIRYISPLQYAVTGLLQNEFQGATIANCYPATDPKCSGEYALSLFSLQDALPLGTHTVLTSPAGVNVLFLVVIYALLVVAAYLVLWLQVRRTTK